MAHFAVVDAGTNTFRLLIANLEDGYAIKTIYSEQAIPRLGEGLSKDGILLPPAMERAIAVLSHFKGVLQKYTIDALAVIGTSAVREAKNQAAFLSDVRYRTGLDIQVISGEEEARHIFSGVNLILQNKKGPMLVIDIGGGSTEFIVAEGESPVSVYSTGLGVVRLTEKYLKSSIPSQEEITALQRDIDQALGRIGHAFPKKGRFAGTAGTVTTLAAMDQKLTVYDPEKINHYFLSRISVRRIFRELSSIPLQQRKEMTGLERGREDIIVAGCLIVLTIMERFGYDRLEVSDYGLREGVLVDLFKNQLSRKNHSRVEL